MYQNIMWALKRKGEWEEDMSKDGVQKDDVQKNDAMQADPVAHLSPEDRKALEIGRKIQKEQKHPFRRKVIGNLSKAAVVLLGVFVLGMSTEANRKRVVGVWNDIVNGELRIDIDTVQNTISREIPEQEAYVEIENQLGITSMKFMSISDELKYNNYSINIQEGRAMLFYQYEDTIVTVYMYSIADVTNRNEGFKGTVVNTVSNINKDLEFEIIKIENPSGENMFVTQLVYESAYYYISGKVPQEIFENLVREIYF